MFIDRDNGGTKWRGISPDGKKQYLAYTKKKARKPRKGEIMLIAKPLEFVSYLDSELIFNWIRQIGCTKSIQGVGRELHIFISAKKMSFEDYQDLYGLFYRYKLDNPEQLDALLHEEYQGRKEIELPEGVDF